FPPTSTLYNIYIYRHESRGAGLPLLHEAWLLTLCINSVYISATLWNTDTTPWEDMTMHIALNFDVQGKAGTLVFTDCAGKTVTFSKEQTVQKKVSMITVGELCGLPKRQLATGFGFKSRTSYYDSRNAVLTGPPEDLLPKRTGPHTRSKRTNEGEALIIRTRSETDGNMYESAEAFTALGFPGSARLVRRVLAASGLSKNTG